ncbi:hypothetical protein AN2V17_36240 [Vallitalea sp. AN17-2]|uniref:Uncharacterized protein n=1 Tax=Vallitalea maricola TaxID=3074433 RepID=A0ACB5UP34_9FIRM|nr:hypothetical protein AN2V17_36240 [Vallitalea sp. AN17-2]
MNIIWINFTTSIFIIFVIILRTIAMHHISKKTFVFLWEIAILQLLIPVRIPSRVNIYSIVSHFSNNAKNSNMYYTQKVSDSNITVISDLTQYQKVIRSQHGIGNTNVLMILWIAGMVILATYFIISFINSYKRLQMSIPVKNNEFIFEWLNQQKIKRKIKVLSSDRIISPITYGILRPKIILPKIIDYSNDQQLNYILTHEMIHIKRCDVLLKLVSLIALCVHWFNPLVWIMHILLNRDIEISCDEKIITVFGENSKSDYALSLINLAETQRGFSHIFSYFGKNAIQERIVMIMKFKKLSTFSIIMTIIFILSFSSVFAMTVDKPISSNNYIDNQKNNRNIVIVTDTTQIQNGSSSHNKSYIYHNGHLNQVNEKLTEPNYKLEAYSQQEYEQEMEDYIANYKNYMSILEKSELYSQSYLQKQQKIYEDNLEMMKNELDIIKSGKGFIYKPVDEKEYIDENGNVITSSISIGGEYYNMD